MIRRRRPAAALPLDDEDLLREILLRLPPQPSSLPRASLVCKRWRRLVSDPVFLRRFRAHHRKTPLLGFFVKEHAVPSFAPALDQPDRIPAARFSRPRSLDRRRWMFLGCRHGLALFLSWSRLEAVLWDPLTGHQRRVSFPLPPGFDHRRVRIVRGAAVVCAAAGDGGHVHGACHLSPFKLVLVFNDIDCGRAFACIYESESGVWGNIISAAATTIDSTRPGILVGNALWWLIRGGRILEFDFERQSLVVIEKPADAHFADYSSFHILRTEDSGLGLAILSELSIQLWKRKSNSEGVVRWVLRKTIQLGELLSRRLCTEKGLVLILDTMRTQM